MQPLVLRRMLRSASLLNLPLSILAVRHYSNALDAYMYVAVAGRAGVAADTGDVSGSRGGGRDSISV